MSSQRECSKGSERRSESSFQGVRGGGVAAKAGLEGEESGESGYEVKSPTVLGSGGQAYLIAA